MTRHDGHDPDQSCVDCGPSGPLRLRGHAVAIGPTIQIWQLYAGLAGAAVDALRDLKRE
jgi:hypothetical protein